MRLIQYILILCFLAGNAFVTAQEELFQMQTYIWEFEADPPEYSQQSSWITDAFESEVLQHKELYRVLERRNLAEVREHEDLNDKLGDNNSEYYQVMVSNVMKPARADASFLGSVTFDEASGEFRIKASLISLSGTQEKYRQAEVSLRKALINDNSSRQEAARELFELLHREEKEATYLEASAMLDEYLFEAQELEAKLMSMDAWLGLKVNGMTRKDPLAEETLMENLDELTGLIERYNEIIVNIKKNQTEQNAALCLYWSSEYCEEFARVQEAVINFHDRLFLDDSNNIINQINMYLQASRSREAKALYEKIGEYRDELTDDIRRDLPALKYEIRGFKDMLSKDLNY